MKRGYVCQLSVLNDFAAADGAHALSTSNDHVWVQAATWPSRKTHWTTPLEWELPNFSLSGSSRPVAKPIFRATERSIGSVARNRRRVADDVILHFLGAVFAGTGGRCRSPMAIVFDSPSSTCLAPMCEPLKIGPRYDPAVIAENAVRNPLGWSCRSSA